MTNKLTLTEQEELFAKDCKLINLKYEYNGYTGDERWAIITELSVKELWEKYPLVIERYSPFVHLSIAQGEVIDDANRNEDKYAKRSSAHLTAMDMTMKCHHSSIKNLPLCLTTRLKEQRKKGLPCRPQRAGRSIVFSAGKAAFRKRGRYGSPQSGKSNAVGAEDEQHPQCCYGNRFE